MYRDDAYQCPVCPGVALRQFGARLICDRCGGMQVGIVDLQEMVGGSDPIVAEEYGETARGCPRCDVPMRGFRITIGEGFVSIFTGCAADGLWIEADALTDLFERVGRSGHAGAALNAHYGGVGRRPRRKKRTTRLSRPPGDEAPLECPVCDPGELRFDGERWACTGCGGAFVASQTLAAMLVEMTGQPWEAPVPTGEVGDRHCPSCWKPMVVETMETVTIDRCAEHGVWFDAEELAALLVQAGQ